MKVFRKTRFLWGVPVVATLLVVGWWATMNDSAESESQREDADEPSLAVGFAPNSVVPSIAKHRGKFRGRLCMTELDFDLGGIEIADRSCIFGERTSPNGEFELTDLTPGITNLRIVQSGIGLPAFVFDNEALTKRYGCLKQGLSQAEILKILRSGPKMSACGECLCIGSRSDDARSRYSIDVKVRPQIVGFLETADSKRTPITSAEVCILTTGLGPTPLTRFFDAPPVRLMCFTSSVPFGEGENLTRSDQNGRFAFLATFDQDYVLEIRAWGFGVYRTRIIRAGEFSFTKPLVVRLSNTRIEIETWSLGRNSLSDLRVNLYWGKSDLGLVKGEDLVVQTVSIVGKTAVFENCAPGNYELRISGVTVTGQLVESAPHKLAIELGARVNSVRLRLPR